MDPARDECVCQPDGHDFSITRLDPGIGTPLAPTYVSGGTAAGGQLGTRVEGARRKKRTQRVLKIRNI